MKIAVIGSGAIGALAAGYLKSKGEDIFLVGRPPSLDIIRNKGIVINGVRGEVKVDIDIFDKLEEKVDLVILAVKTQDLEAVLERNFSFLKDAFILTTQNGLQADAIAGRHLPLDKIISSIVMFGSTCLEAGKVTHNFEGKWVLGRPSLNGESKPFGEGRDISNLAEALNRIFPVVVTDDISGMKWLKVFVNANNCIPAILGKSMQECFSSLDLSGISINIWKEGYKIVRALGIKLVSLPGFEVEKVTKLVSLPTPQAAQIYSGIMTKLSKEPLYGSILQSIKRGKKSEIDYINGQIVKTAKERGLQAPLNEKIVELVHRVEGQGKFLTKPEFLSELEGAVTNEVQ